MSERISTKIERVCKNCNQTFWIFPSLLITPTRGHFCCKECRLEKITAKVLRVCQCCGIEFFSKNTYVKKGGALYCSLHCRSLREGELRRMRTPLAKRFWNKVDKTETCWLWTGSKDRHGYGHIVRSGSSQRTTAHRLSWEIHFGPIPDGLCVCHNCPDGDNPSCVNPAHLWLGTIADNANDKARKGRAAKKLTKEDVKQIRIRYQNGESQKNLSLEYNVHVMNIFYVIHNMIWKHA